MSTQNGEDIVFCCETCDKEIVRDSREHDECLWDEKNDKWYCGDCGQHTLEAKCEKSITYYDCLALPKELEQKVMSMKHEMENYDKQCEITKELIKELIKDININAGWASGEIDYYEAIGMEYREDGFSYDYILDEVNGWDNEYKYWINTFIECAESEWMISS